MPDVAIIGAGPAGALAAILLARRGWRVTLIEQSRFPRDKVCGESLSALGLDVLARHGLLDSLRALGPVVLTGTALHAQDGRSLALRLPGPMWGLSRRALDAALLDVAREAGATIRQPLRVEGLARVGPTLRTRDLTTNEVDTITATAVLLADGKAALLPARPRPTADLGVKAHFAGVAGPRDAVELFGVHGHYVGVAPVESGLTNVAFSVPSERLRSFGSDLDRLWRQLLSENAGLADRFANAPRVSDWLASPLPRFAVVRDWPPGVIPLGNAAAALEPIGGEGIGLALRSAELAADALDAAHRVGRPFDPGPLRRQFSRLWRPRRVACRAVATLLSNPSLASPTIELASASEPLARFALRMIGKGGFLTRSR